MKNISKLPTQAEAERLSVLVNTLSLFTRKIMLDWLPAMMTDIGLTEERFMTLFEIKLQPGISLKQLAQSMMMSPSNLSVMIHALVKQGLVIRDPDPEDRRRVLLKLSEQGEQIYEQANQFSIRQYQLFLSRINPVDRQTLGEAADRMISISEKIMQEL